MTSTVIAPSLYDRDFSLWVEDVAARLKARDFELLDIENLIEEIESLGRTERHELKNRLDVLLSHILKRVYVPIQNDRNGWERTIREQRKQIKRRLADSPSLKNYLPEIFDEILEDVIAELREDYPQVQFPDTWQFSRDVDAILSEAFWENI
ncbi:DUF29 domain-containing protein [Tumidithrix elongata RA019]|uniref:DUF29 domain-containing protein n=1 Tax=Tumidithrix elongata BACA0141 TaxID=2716417 RepID=A0AAW9PVY3_9CYAN|nr:DUF29 domain-containing protein [Tumidithrix elongata RA019]